MYWLQQLYKKRNVSIAAVRVYIVAAVLLVASWWLQQTLIPFNRFVLYIATGILGINGGLVMVTARKDALIADILAVSALVCQASVLILLIMAGRAVSLL